MMNNPIGRQHVTQRVKNMRLWKVDLQQDQSGLDRLLGGLLRE